MATKIYVVNVNNSASPKSQTWGYLISPAFLRFLKFRHAHAKPIWHPLLTIQTSAHGVKVAKGGPPTTTQPPFLPCTKPQYEPQRPNSYRICPAEYAQPTRPMIVKDKKHIPLWNIVFLTSDLLKNSIKWSTGAKTYMQTQGNEIRIYDVCLEYYRLVDKFYFWLYRELKKHHQKDLEERKK